MSGWIMRKYDCVVRLHRKFEPAKFQVEAHTVTEAAEFVRDRHGLWGPDPHRGFVITEAW